MYWAQEVSGESFEFRQIIFAGGINVLLCWSSSLKALMGTQRRGKGSSEGVP
jgi:hypothetical protein